MVPEGGCIGKSPALTFRHGQGLHAAPVVLEAEAITRTLLCPECDRTKAALSVVGLLAILERRRREARGGGVIDG